jgi:hypothetical protein
MKLNLEQCLTVVAGLGCTVSITAMIAIALQSNIEPQRISISLGLPVVEAGTATQLEVKTVALEPLQQSHLADVVWFESLDSAAVSQRSANFKELSLPDMTSEAELTTCASVYSSKLTLSGTCELQFPAIPVPSIAAVSTQFPTPAQLLDTNLLGPKPGEYQ